MNLFNINRVMSSSENALTTTFRGRLGYACLNTILRAQRPPVFSSRKCRLKTLKSKGMEYVKELGLQNARDIVPMLEWNEAHNIKFMRLSSDMFPFASHPDHGYSLDFAADVLREAGDVARNLGHRLTMHPGQFTQLGSPRDVVVTNAMLDLKVHCEILDHVGLGKDSVMIIHMGGVFGDKQETIRRFEENFMKLPQRVRDRIVLENDEMSYSVDDLLPICKKLQIPLVLDWHHDSLNPSSKSAQELWPEIRAIWEARGITPKQHHSEARPGAQTIMEKRAHSNRVTRLPPCDPDVDLMIEAKHKEQAVFQLYKTHGMYPVNDDVYVPEEGVLVEVEDEMSIAGHEASTTDVGEGSMVMDGDVTVVSTSEPKRKRRKGVAVDLSRDVGSNLVTSSALALELSIPLRRSSRIQDKRV